MVDKVRIVEATEAHELLEEFASDVKVSYLCDYDLQVRMQRFSTLLSEIEDKSSQTKLARHIWTKLAELGVKHSNLELALKCVSKLNADYVFMLAYEALEQYHLCPLEARHSLALSKVATHFGWHDVAITLIKLAVDQGAPYSELIHHYIRRNEWSNALAYFEAQQNEERSPSFHKSFQLKYGEHLEQEGQITEACLIYEKLQMYDRAAHAIAEDIGAHRPGADIIRLRKYCLIGEVSLTLNATMSKTDRKLMLRRKILANWFAEYCRFDGRFEEAMNVYKDEQDYKSVIDVIMSWKQDPRKAVVFMKDLCDKNGLVSCTELLDNGSPNRKFEICGPINREMARVQNSLRAGLLRLADVLVEIDPKIAFHLYVALDAKTQALACARSHVTNANQFMALALELGSQEDIYDSILHYLDSAPAPATGNHDDVQQIKSTDNNHLTLARAYLRCGLFQESLQCASNLDEAQQSALIQLLVSDLTEICANQSNFGLAEDTWNEESLAHLNRLLLTNPSISLDVLELFINSLNFASQQDMRNSQSTVRFIEHVLIESPFEITDSVGDKIKLWSRNLTRVFGAHGKNISSLAANKALDQGQFRVAAKLFNHIGDRLNAAQALIRTGDADTIIKYAQLVNDKIVYRLCANYLRQIRSDLALIRQFAEQSV